MKRMMRVVRILIVAEAFAGIAGGVQAEDLRIQSFDGTGRLTFNELPTATVYRVEWAPTPAGPWTNSWSALAAVQAAGSGSVTCSVPMCYRVVAIVAPSGVVPIPAGTNSGTDPDFGAYSLTNQTAFYMDATEVTKAQWDEVAAWGATNGYTDLPAGGGKAVNHPVQMVSWYACVKWCNARSEKDGRTPCYTEGHDGRVCRTGSPSPDCDFGASGYRLPTMTEWEYAARGGMSGRRFPWGDTIQHSRANYYSESYDSCDTSPTRGYHPTYAKGGTPYTSPVGAFAANGYGLYDMAGNVFEWCNESSGSYRYCRGGCWYKYAGYARCGSNNWGNLDASTHVGFRAVCR